MNLETSIEKLNFDQIPLDDEKTWDLICAGDTTGVFQLESTTGKTWAKKVKPRNIEELAALIALVRPGPLMSGQSDLYVSRRSGKEEIKYDHRSLEPYLKDTYGVNTFQEQSISIAKEIAGFTDEESNMVRIMTAKKRPEDVAKLRKMFIDGAVRLGRVSQEDAEHIFESIETAQRYSFNKCICGNSIVITPSGEKRLSDIEAGEFVLSQSGFVKVKSRYYNGPKRVIDIVTENNFKLRATINHKILCEDGLLRPISEIVNVGYKIVTTRDTEKIIGVNYDFMVLDTYDLEVDHPDHTYYANGILVSNSHSIGYALPGYYSAYIKSNYPTEFFTAWLSFANDKPNPREEIRELVQNARATGVMVSPPDIKVGNNEFLILEKGRVLFGLSSIRGIGSSAIEKINEQKGVVDFQGFLQIAPKLHRNICESLIKSGACDCFGLPRYYMLQCVYMLFGYNHTEDVQDEYKSLTANELRHVMKNIGIYRIEECLDMLISDKVAVKKRFPVIQKKVNHITQKFEDTNRQNSIWEKLYLGINLTCSAADDYEKLDSNIMSCCETQSLMTGDKGTFHVVIDEVTMKKTGEKAKNPGQEYCILECSDNTGRIKIMCWPREFKDLKGVLKEGLVISITAKKDSWGDRDQYVMDNIKIIG